MIKNMIENVSKNMIKSKIYGNHGLRIAIVIVTFIAMTGYGSAAPEGITMLSNEFNSTAEYLLHPQNATPDHFDIQNTLLSDYLMHSPKVTHSPSKINKQSLPFPARPEPENPARILVKINGTKPEYIEQAAFTTSSIITVNDSGGADYTRIQDAINNSNHGDTILVYSGTYSEHVNVNKQLILQGIDTGGGIPVVDAAGSGSAITLSAGWSMLKGFEAINSDNSGIMVTSNNNIIKNNTALNNNEDGISLYSSSNNTLSDNNASSNTWAGIYLESSSNNTLSNNIVYSNNDNGIQLDFSSNNKLSGNNASSNTWTGIYLESSSNNTLTNNNANSNNVDGIYFDSSDNNTLTDNIVYSNKDDGIQLDFSSRNKLSSNNVSLNIWDGIYLHSSSDNTISDNIAHSNTWTGIYLEYSSNNTLSGNNASLNNVNGFYLNSSSNNTLSNNIIYSNNGDGIQLDSSSSNNLSDNNASLNNVGFYLDSSSNNILNDNIAHSNTWNGISLESSSNNTLSDNIAHSNTWIGIYLEYSSDNMLNNNTAFLNTWDGIYLYTSSNNILSDNTARSNTWDGIYLHSSINNTLSSNNVSNNQVGIYVVNSSEITISNNTGSNNNYAIFLYNFSNNSTIKHNIVINNTDGIVLYNSHGNNLLNNEVAESKQTGLQIINSSKNSIIDNNISNNAYFGIFLIEASYNNLTNNAAEGNFYYNFIQYGSDDNIIDNIYYNYTEVTRGLRFSINEKISPYTQAIASENATYWLDIANVGLVNDTYILEVSNLDKANVSLNINMRTISLESGQRANLTLTISGVHPGGYSVNIDARSINDANITEHVETYTIVTGIVTAPPDKKISAKQIRETYDLDYSIIDSLKVNSTVSLSAIENSVLKEAVVLKSRVYNSTVINSTISGLILENALVEDNTIIYGNITINGIKYTPSNIPISDIVTGYDQKRGSLVGMISAGKNLKVEALGTNVSFSISTIKDFFAGSLSVQRSKVQPEGVLPDNDNVEYLSIEASRNLQTGAGWRYMKIYYNRNLLGDLDETTLRLQYFNESSQEWESIHDSGVNTTEGYVWGNTSHFSTFALAAEKIVPESRSSSSGSGNKLENKLSITTKYGASKEERVPKDIIQMEVESPSQISNPDNIRPAYTGRSAPAAQSSKKNIPGFEGYLGLACLFMLRQIKKNKN